MAGQPPEIDWREFGILDREAIEQNAYECWAIVGADTAEAQYYIHGDDGGEEILPDTSPSVQQFIDCDLCPSDDENGGLVEDAYEEMRLRGVATARDYPRWPSSVRRRRRCRHCINGLPRSTMRPIVRIRRYTEIPIEEQGLITALDTVGPLSVAVTCGTDSFDRYSGGVTRAGFFHYWEDDEALGIGGHYMTLLGCGVDLLNGQPYWLLLNTYGPEWGEEGCMRLHFDMTNFFEEAWYPEGVYRV